MQCTYQQAHKGIEQLQPSDIYIYETINASQETGAMILFLPHLHTAKGLGRQRKEMDRREDMDQDKTQKRRGNLAALRTLDKVPGMKMEHVKTGGTGGIGGGSGQGIKTCMKNGTPRGRKKEVEGKMKGPCLCLWDGVGGGHGLG